MSGAAVSPTFVPAAQGRPSAFAVAGLALVGLIGGSILARVPMAFIPGVSAAGSDATLPFLVEGPLSVAAGLGLLFFQTVVVVGLTRVALSGDESRPAWIYVFGVLLAAIAAAGAVGGWLGLLVLVPVLTSLRWIAYEADGTVRPDPLRLDRRGARVVGAVLASLGLLGGYGYGVLHPLVVQADGSLQDPIEATTRPLEVALPQVNNDGGPTARVVAIEPGVERGAALRLADVRVYPNEGWRTLPFMPYELSRDGMPTSVVLRFSRAGCTPGATGYVESVRMRYELAGKRTLTVPFDPPLSLRC